MPPTARARAVRKKQSSKKTATKTAATKTAATKTAATKTAATKTAATKTAATKTAAKKKASRRARATPTTSAALTVSLERARALWCAKQGLGRPAPGDGRGHAALLEATGCLRTLGGVDVYLALRARNPSATRASIDAAAAAGELRVTPAVRGCIYVAPARHAPDFMALAAALQRPRTERDLDRVGASWAEVHDLAKLARAALRRGGPLTTAALRAALPEGSVRSLGAVGKRVGLSSLLPVALRELEFTGQLERTLEGGRLDTERYLWRVTGKRATSRSASLSQPLAAIVHHCLEWFAPITVKQLASWIGVPQRDIKAALAGMSAIPVTIEDHAREAWLLERERDALAEASPDPRPREFVFLPFADTMLSVHDGPAVHVDPAHHGVRVKTWGGRGKEEALGSCNHLGHRPLLLGDRMVGLWEYDPRAGEVVTRLFAGAPPRGTKRALQEGGAHVAAFIHDELEHACSFSLDTEARVQARADALRG